MIRKFFEWLEEWVMDDDSTFIGIGKLLLVISIFAAIILGPFIYADATAPSFTLRKDEWRCIDQQMETHLVMVGKVLVPQTDMVCVEYKRISAR